jgi:hypothetical protein
MTGQVPGGGEADFARRSDLERWLARAERSIALLERARPLNFASERARLLESWRSGRVTAPAFQYAPPPALSALRAALDAVIAGVESDDAWGSIYAGRAFELGLEARAAEAVGTPDFAERAAARFPDDETTLGRLANKWSAAWQAQDSGLEADRQHVSDDDRDPHSLVACMRRAVGERRLAVRVVISAELPTLAAAAAGVVFVRARQLHTLTEARRIVVHEIEGHVLPRVRASGEELGLFALGTAGGSDDQEGRALLLEEQSKTLDARRRATLARRHAAARALRQGASWVETVELLIELGSELGQAIDLASRIHRGGGLGREIVYLPALARVRAAAEQEPWLLSWLERGRISVAAARELAKLGDPPSWIGARRAA